MSIVMYSSGCPQCNVLKAKLDDKNIEYQYIENKELMIEKGFKHAPQLEIDGEIYSFNEARKLVDQYNGTENFEQFVNNKKAE